MVEIYQIDPVRPEAKNAPTTPDSRVRTFQLYFDPPKPPPTAPQRLDHHLVSCPLAFRNGVSASVVHLAEDQAIAMCKLCQKDPKQLIHCLGKIIGSIEAWVQAIEQREAGSFDHIEKVEDALTLVSGIYKTHALLRLKNLSKEQRWQLENLHERFEELWHGFNLKQHFSGT